MRDAAVLVPVYRSADGDIHIVMVLRSEGGVHGGQLAFPGGKRDQCDDSMLETALREAREEVGVHPDMIEVLEKLPIVETRTTGYRVHPYLGRVVAPVQWRRAEREIADIIDVTLADLVRRETHDRIVDQFPPWAKAEKGPFYRVGSHRLWGLSYRIIHPLIPRLVAGHWTI